MNDQEDTQDQLPAILEEETTRQELLPFEGDTLAAAMGASGSIYVTVSSLCAAFGLNQRGQMIRIMRTPTLARGVRRMPIATSGGLQRVNCLRLDKVPMWVAGMETVRIKEPLRPKIEQYQEQLAPFAMQVFMRVMGIASATPANADPRLASMLDQFDTLINVALDLQAQMASMSAIPEQIDAMRWQLDQAMELLESIAGDNAETRQAVEKLKTKTAGLTKVQARNVKEQISHMVAITEGTPGEMKYATIYGRIQYRFRVPTYSLVPDTQYEVLMQFLRDELQKATGQEEPRQGSLF